MKKLFALAAVIALVGCAEKKTVNTTRAMAWAIVKVLVMQHVQLCSVVKMPLKKIESH